MCRSELIVFRCRILNKLSTKAYAGWSLLFWKLSPASFFVIVLLFCKVLHFSGHTQSLSLFLFIPNLFVCFALLLELTLHLVKIFLHCVKQSCALSILLSLLLPSTYSFSVQFKITFLVPVQFLLFQEAFPDYTSPTHSFLLLTILISKLYLVVLM